MTSFNLIGMIHLQELYRRPPLSGSANDHCAMKFKMIIPTLSARIEQSNQRTGVGVEGR